MRITYWLGLPAVSTLLIGLQFCAVPHQLKLQGITGYTYRQYGNQMPRRGGHNPATGNGTAVQIAVYAALKAGNTPHKGALFTIDSIRPVATGMSDGTGKYHISLPPGSYSILFKTNRGWYADETDGNGYVNLIVINKGQWLERDFVVRQGGIY